MATHDKPPEPSETDERVVIPLDPEEALRALLKVDPHAPPATDDELKSRKRSKT